MKLLCCCAVAILLAAGLSFSDAQLQTPTKPGVERWSIKTSVVAKTPKSVAWDGFIGLANPAGVQKDDPRYQNKRIPAFTNSLNVKEGDIVTLTCWLHLVALESDGDYHIQVSNDSADGNNCVVVEVPKPDPAYVASDSLRPLFAAVRDWVKTKLLHSASTEPSPIGNVMTHPPHVSVTGQLFFDDSHVGDPPRGKRNMKAITLWEIHPVTGMSFAPKPHR